MTTQLLGNKCEGGHSCTPPKDCCRQGCCFFINQSSFRPATVISGNVFNPLFLGHWYFWLAVTATVAGILCACSLWKKHSQGYLCCTESRTRDERSSEPDSNGSCYAPPQYSRCNSFYQAPPPYSEVTSKPDLYPLVISYNTEPVTKTNASTGYLMVQYFRNFIVRPAGTLSATSTIDSLSSSFICNAANEANTIIPPPYSNIGSLEEVVSENQFSMPFNEARNLQQSTSHNAMETSDSIIVENNSTLIASLRQVTPVHIPCLMRPQSVVSIRSNPCFGQNTTSTAKVPNEYNKPKAEKLNKTQTQMNCDDNPSNVNRKLLLRKLSKEQSTDSENQDEDHCFSELLNFSTCAVSSSTAAQAEISVNSNPQVHELQYSVTNSMTGSDISSLANLGTPDSPPRATSPTMEMKEILDRIQKLPHQKSPTSQHSQDGLRFSRSYFHKMKAKTLYMPLYESNAPKSKNLPNVFSRSWISRSAPNTPCGNIVPNFPSVNKMNQTGKNIKIKVTDGSPLLTEHDESEEDVTKDESL